MNLYHKVLYILLTNNLVGKNIILSLSSCKAIMNRIIKQLIEDGYIKELVLTKKNVVNNRVANKILRAYVITIDGIKYMINGIYKGKPKWLDFIPKNIKRPSILDGKNADKLIRYINISNNNVIASLIGENNNPLFLKTYDKIEENDFTLNNNKTSVVEKKGEANCEAEYEAKCEVKENENCISYIVENAIYLYEQENGEMNVDLRLEKNEIVKKYNFVNSIKLKKLYNKDSAIKNNKSLSDYTFGIYVGVLENDCESFLVYSSVNYNMSWNKKNSINDIKIFHNYKKNYSKFKIANKLSENNSILLVQNSKMFFDIFTDRLEKRKEIVKDIINEKNVLGYGFDNMYCIPISYIGIKHLKWIMETNIEEFEERIICEAISNKSLEKNETGNIDLFPIKNKLGTIFTVGVCIDIVKLKKIEKLKNLNKISNFGIICFKWQKEYYKKIFPKAILTGIDIR